MVCMLEECFGLPIPRDEWDQIKKSFAVVAQKPCVTPSRQNKRSLLLPDVAVEAVDEFPQQLSGRNKIGSPCGSQNSSASRSCSRSTVTSCGSKSQRLSVSDSHREEQLQHELDLARAQNLFLQKLLVSSQTRNKEQAKTIKEYKNKLAKAECKADKIKQLMLKQVGKKKDEFNITRVQDSKNVDKQLRHLRADRFELFEDAETDLDARKPKSHLTPQGSVALAVRRSLGNCSAEDLGLILLDDASKQTVLRCECKAAAALLANSRLFFQSWEQDVRPLGQLGFTDVVHDSARVHETCSEYTSFFFAQYREDATNSSTHRQKMSALELDCRWVTVETEDELESLQVQPQSFNSLLRLADVVPVHDGTGPGTLALCDKMLQSLGCPSLQKFLRAHRESQLPLG